MNEAGNRAALYGAALAIIGGIGAWWVSADKEADVMTLLSSADVQLRMAYGLPAADAAGRAMSERENMIRTAVRFLEDVDRRAPGMAVTAEFRGFAHMLDGEFDAAAACYRRARGCADVQDEQRDVLTFNEARMLAQAGNREQALAVFAERGAELDARYGHQRRLEEAAILRQLGRRAEATQRLDVVLRDAEALPMARLQAGRECLELGLFERAEQALEGVREELPIANYHIARLKLCRGDVDSCLEFLGRASEARPTEVRQLLQDEANAWSTVADDARFQELTMPQPASPGR